MPNLDEDRAGQYGGGRSGDGGGEIYPGITEPPDEVPQPPEPERPWGPDSPGGGEDDRSERPS